MKGIRGIINMIKFLKIYLNGGLRFTMRRQFQIQFAVIRMANVRSKLFVVYLGMRIVPSKTSGARNPSLSCQDAQTQRPQQQNQLQHDLWQKKHNCAEFLWYKK